MPLPIILGISATVAAVAGVGSGVSGAKKMKDANDTLKLAKEKNDENIELFKEQNDKTTKAMDALGKKELKVIKSFAEFSDLIEKIQNRPDFAELNIESDVKIKYEAEEVKEASIGAGVLLGGLGGAAAGTAGGFAAAGVTTSAVMAFGTASTGAAISGLSGAAAVNATLAALGGGAVGSSALAGGMALGTQILGFSTLGVGLLVGGVIFNAVGSNLSDKADEAWRQMRKNETKIAEINKYLVELYNLATKYKKSFDKVSKIYYEYLENLRYTIEDEGKTDWGEFDDNDKIITQNTVLLVGLLYQMGKVKLVKESKSEEEVNEVNRQGANKQMKNADKILEEVAWSA